MVYKILLFKLSIVDKNSSNQNSALSTKFFHSKLSIVYKIFRLKTQHWLKHLNILSFKTKHCLKNLKCKTRSVYKIIPLQTQNCLKNSSFQSSGLSTKILFKTQHYLQIISFENSALSPKLGSAWKYVTNQQNFFSHLNRNQQTFNM
jgi:hypothetical protein